MNTQVNIVDKRCLKDLENICMTECVDIPMLRYEILIDSYWRKLDAKIELIGFSTKFYKCKFPEQVIWPFVP